MKFLCDTNILSELARPAPNAGVLAWAEDVREIAVSVVTVEEVFYGLALRPNVRVEAWFEDFLFRYCRLLEITPSIARFTGDLRGRLAARDKTRTQADMLIAATAVIHGLTLVTRNTKDFTGCEVALLNPFTSH
jgi:toxin FitB